MSAAPRWRAARGGRRPVAVAPGARPPWRWALLGALLGAIGAGLWFAPASLLAWGIDQATRGQLQLHDARGSLWRGDAQWVLTGGAGSRDALSLPGRVQWRLSPRWTGARLSLHADCCTRVDQPIDVTVQPGWGRVRVQVADGASRWPAGLLVGLGTPFNTLQAEGQLQLQTQGVTLELAQGRSVLGGQLTLLAEQMTSRLSTIKPMGSYRVQIHGGASPTLTLSTMEGALQLSGQGEFVGQRLRFRGEAQAAPGREAALHNLLNILGRREGARALLSVG